jgi:hypothetical protein
MKTSKIHTIHVKFNCDCCGGYEQFLDDVYLYDAEQPKMAYVDLLSIDDLNGGKVTLCPKCAVKGMRKIIELIREKE